MKYKILYSSEALKDLDEIWEYILMELGNADAAKNTINNVMNTIDALEVFPERGTPLSAVVEIESDYRFVLSGSYMVFYRVESQTVFIDRILYERREYIKVLFENLPLEDK